MGAGAFVHTRLSVFVEDGTWTRLACLLAKLIVFTQKTNQQSQVFTGGSWHVSQPDRLPVCRRDLVARETRRSWKEDNSDHLSGGCRLEVSPQRTLLIEAGSLTVSEGAGSAFCHWSALVGPKSPCPATTISSWRSPRGASSARCAAKPWGSRCRSPPAATDSATPASRSSSGTRPSYGHTTV